MNIRRTRGLGPRPVTFSVPVDITLLLGGGYGPGGSVSRRSSEKVSKTFVLQIDSFHGGWPLRQIGTPFYFPWQVAKNSFCFLNDRPVAPIGLALFLCTTRIVRVDAVIPAGPPGKVPPSAHMDGFFVTRELRHSATPLNPAVQQPTQEVIPCENKHRHQQHEASKLTLQRPCQEQMLGVLTAKTIHPEIQG